MTWRRFAPVLLLLAVLGAAACSGSSNADTDDDATATTAAGEGGSGDDGGPSTSPAAFVPVTIEHRYGSTEVTERPERIVSLDTQWTDVLIALDAPPVAYIGDPSAPDDFPWRGDALADSTRLEATTALPREQIIEAAPDLIVVTYLAEDEQAYQDLSDIAPVISTLGDGQVDTWQAVAEAAGDVLGVGDAVADLVTEVDDQVAAVGNEVPDLAGKTFTFANYVPGDAMYVLSDPTDGANVLFSDLGLEIAPAILSAGESAPGRVTLSLEQIELLDADLVMVLTNGAAIDEIPGLGDVPAVAADDGSAVVMGYEQAVALNTPTPLSIPWALDDLRPALEAAAA